MIRPIEPQDLPTVHRLQNHLRYADPELIKNAIEGPFYAVVAVDTIPIGYAIAFPGTPATLVELVVAPEYRQQGYGRALLNAVTERIEATTISVLTPADNTVARQFYESLKFDFECRIEAFYDDGTDALRLRRCV